MHVNDACPRSEHGIPAVFTGQDRSERLEFPLDARSEGHGAEYILDRGLGRLNEIGGISDPPVSLLASFLVIGG